MTAPLDLDALEAAARAATPGPWWADKHEDWAYPQTEVLDQPTGKPVTFYNSRPEYDQFMFCGTRGKAELEWANATFIAAANPAAVLALIERLRAAEAALAAAKKPPHADDVEWIVNDMGELGVRVMGRCYFCYKGESLVYEHGIHDGNEPILHRNVGKREFGETVWPMAWIKAGRSEHRYKLELVYTPGLSFGPPDNPKHKWMPLPVEVPHG